MKEKTYLLNILLAVFTGLVLIGAMMVRVFVPVAFVPTPGIPELVLFSLIVLLFDHYFRKAEGRCYVCVFLLSAVTFGILPWIAGFVSGTGIVKTALMGAVVFTATAWVFQSMEDRMNSGKKNKLAPVVHALCFYLAVQGLAGMF